MSAPRLSAAIAAGVRRTSRRLGCVAVLWATHAGLTFVFAAGLAQALLPLAGQPRFARALDQGDVGTLLALASEFPGAITAALALFAAMLVPSLLLGQALTAGVLTRLVGDDERPPRHAAQAFAAGVVQHTAPLLRLYVLVVLIWLPALATATLSLPGMLYALDHAVTPSGAAMVLVTRLGPALPLALVAEAVAQHARLALVTTGDGRALRALARGFATVLTHPATLVPAGLGALAQLALVVAGVIVVAPLDGGSHLGLALVVLVRQLFALARAAVRLGTLATAATWHRPPG